MNATHAMKTAALSQNALSSLITSPAPAAPVARTLVAPKETVPESPKRISENPASNPSPAPEKKGNRRPFILSAALLAAAVAAGFYYYQFVAPFESTDDAFIEAHVTAVAPQVAGRVAQLAVKDNQLVKAGDLLVQIDPSDYQAKLDQARANLAAAKSRLEQAIAQSSVDQAKIESEKANVIAAEAEAKRAEADSRRYQAVGITGVSQSQLDLAATQARSAAAQVDAVRNRELAAESQLSLSKANIQTAFAEVQRSEAMVRQAELDLSYTQVRATEAGHVTHRTVESGAYVQTGQALLAVVPRQVWVVANFKETQLTRIRPGQAVEVKVDAYPGVKFRGHVDSIQSGAGARFSLLPPENASGNYVKVVQRVPVKIALDELPGGQFVLGPGMSAVPRIRVN